ncbi:glycosyl hydrolase family 65 protein [Lacticaseibacillus pabuli]|uniref:Glycosyl hydrolase family 65 protein n=1 Tax=Lacticaseibacillus pabuli TaxID=3025672 RepID=A0ABY7WRQ9_9LACO|nr:glycosyl hydrolase family 65 protein [Lacticaseibacillus sp. KACC 23028]WDF82406.1 glycosyl hydrolase family 65 protein [Lacticaseibacillus sp. KACC 23028]
MDIVDLKINDDAIVATYQPASDNPLHREFVIAYDPAQSIGANLENLRVQLVGLDFDAIVIENPLTYDFSDTVVGLNRQRLDIGLALTNMLDVPVVSASTVQRLGIDEALRQKKDADEWQLAYYGEYAGKRNKGQEAMLTIGNGFYGLRGAYVEATADKDNYPGLYVAGVYDQNTTTVNGRDIVNEDLVNLPNPQYLSVGIDHSNPVRIRPQDIRDVYRSLDLKTGQLKSTMMIKLSTGHQFILTTTKIADMQAWHQLAIRYTITPLNFAGSLQVYAAIDGHVQNSNVDRYNRFDQQHISVTGMSSAGTESLLTGSTLHSKIDFAIAAKLSSPDQDITTLTKSSNTPDAIRQVVNLTVQPEHTYTIDKLVSIYTSRESTGALDKLAWNALTDASFDITAGHTTAFYHDVWQDCDFTISNDITAQKLLRVNVFHLFVSGAALASGQLDASVGARGLHGEAYRGHIFWDEMFMMPFYVAHAPLIAKNMLLYRYNRLAAARQYATDNDRQGAMYPWQSGAKGDEQSQSVHLNPLTNQFDPDNSRRQRHVSLSVAYDVWLYWHQTGDDQFMTDYGWEMLLAIAKMWLSMTRHDDTTGRYHIDGVMGPDEFHENYPNSDKPGLTDNAYTNMMVAWLFKLLEENHDDIPTSALTTAKANDGWQAKDFTQIATVRRHLALDINEDGIIAQFAGYFKLPKLDFNEYRKQYGDISRLDRILKAHGKTPDAYQVAKQADTLMAFFLLDKPTLDDLLDEMGYHLPADYFAQNLQYYLARTTHGSTLSRIVYAALERSSSRDQSWELFRQALFSDYYDIQGGTTAEGIHVGVMGATLDVASRVLAGVNTWGNQLTVTPHLPREWQRVAFTSHFAGATIRFVITRDQITATTDQPLTMQIGGRAHTFAANQAQTITYREER